MNIEKGEKRFNNYTTKEKCAMILLSCLDWGCGNALGTKEEVDKKIKGKLKLQHSFEIWRLRSCIDLIEDTESAIIYYSTFGLEKFNEMNCRDHGEMYIKLYGVLNAVYLQLNAIIDIYEICKIPNKEGVINKFKSHPIFEMRNIIGAHTSNFEDRSDFMPPNFKCNSFRISQMQLNAKGDNLHAADSFNNLKKFDLYELIISYNELSEKILYNGCIDYMNRIFRNSISKKNKVLTHFELTGFENYNYRKLYKNDKLTSEYLKNNMKELNNMYSDDLDELV